MDHSKKANFRYFYPSQSRWDNFVSKAPINKRKRGKGKNNFDPIIMITFKRKINLVCILNLKMYFYIYRHTHKAKKEHKNPSFGFYQKNWWGSFIFIIKSFSSQFSLSMWHMVGCFDHFYFTLMLWDSQSCGYWVILVWGI
jgi:hypothetical protein